MSKYKNSNGIKIGDLVRDSYDRIGIVVGKAATPDSLWLREQGDSKLRGLLKIDSDTIPKYLYEFWIEILPLDGGATITTADLVSHNFGQVTVEAYVYAYNNANASAKNLLEMLPIYCEYRKNPLATA
tara:strand:+ start:1375 stop:1758 length:384 start_codon:yes stop_codon:yes gene_type:complete